MPVGRSYRRWDLPFPRHNTQRDFAGVDPWQEKMERISPKVFPISAKEEEERNGRECDLRFLPPKEAQQKKPYCTISRAPPRSHLGEVGSFSRSGLSGRDTATTGEQHDGVESDSRPSQSFPSSPLLARGGLPSLQ